MPLPLLLEISVPKFILLNGPPRSGKDTAAKALLSIRDKFIHEKFSAPLKEAFAGMMNVSIDDFMVEYYEECKDEIIPFLGVSFRQWQIDFSEKFMKPLYGIDVFGRLLINRIDSYSPNTYVISDCGFQIEVDHVIKNFPEKDVLLVRLHRQGCTYDGDSRGYVKGPNVIDIYNNDAQDLFERRIRCTLDGWL